MPPPTYQPCPLFRRYSTPGCTVLVVPKTLCASALRSGCHTSSTYNTASITPSESRRATLLLPGFSDFANASGTSSVIGIGQTKPLLNLVSWQTRWYSARCIKPRSGEKPPLRRSSRSRICRLVKSQEGKSLERALSSAAFSGSSLRSTSSPPCGAIRWPRDCAVSILSIFMIKSASILLRGYCRNGSLWPSRIHPARVCRPSNVTYARNPRHGLRLKDRGQCDFYAL